MIERADRELLGRLRSTSLLIDCPVEDCAAFAAVAAPFSVPAHWAFVREGSPADSCYLLLEGSVGVFRGRQRIATLGPGELIGEMAFFGGGQRRATVASTSRLRGLRVDYRSLDDLIRRRPSFGEAVHAVYRERVMPVPVLSVAARPGSPLADRPGFSKGAARCAHYPSRSARSTSMTDRS